MTHFPRLLRWIGQAYKGEGGGAAAGSLQASMNELFSLSLFFLYNDIYIFYNLNLIIISTVQ